MTITAAAVVSHQPGIMLPDEVRQKMPGGDYSLIAGFAEMRKRLAAAQVGQKMCYWRARIPAAPTISPLVSAYFRSIVS